MREKHKQVILEITQFYGEAESVRNIKEMFGEELKTAEVQDMENESYISYKFQMDHEIARRIEAMFKAVFGSDQNIGGGNFLQVEIHELNRTIAQQDHDYIVNETPYDED